MSEPRAMTIYDFARETGGVTDADVDGHLHAGLRAAGQPKTYHRWFAKRLKELQDARTTTLAAFYGAIERGEIRPPTEQEKLKASAKGHPDNESVRAAQRLLEKKRLRGVPSGSTP